MVYNMDFLIAAMVILLLILWDFLGQIEMIVYTGQTVRVHIWVIDRDKQGENTKA